MKSGPNEDIVGDPLPALEAELSKYKYVKVDGLDTFTGGYKQLDIIQPV